MTVTTKSSKASWRLTRNRLVQIVGGVGLLIYVALLVATPSFPTPDKLFVVLVLAGVAVGQAIDVIKRFGPFVLLLLVYESFRGLAPNLNAHVNYQPMIWTDRVLGLAQLPTERLQHLLWHGTTRWYDFAFYGAYMLHFVLPFALAVLIWRTRESEYWRYIATYLTVSFTGFLTYLVFPAAPPWLASDNGHVQPVARVASFVWEAFGVHDPPSVYNRISPNPVAAVPSLHAAYSFLFAYFITRLYKNRWRYVAWLHPILIWVGTVYMGEHYLIDEILGVAYAIGAYVAAPHVLRWTVRTYERVKLKAALRE